MNFKRLFSIAALMALSAIAIVGQERQDVVDDGFTWFEAFSTTELTGNNIPTATGWTLKYWTRVIGRYPLGSRLNFVVSKQGRKIFSTLCDTANYQRSGRDIDESFIRTAECWQSKSATKEIGEFEVQVLVVNGETMTEKPVRTYRIDVRAVERVPAGQGAGVDPPRYYINRHNEAPVAFLNARPAGYVPYFDVADRPERADVNKVDLYFSLSPSEAGRLLPQGELSCDVDGRKVNFAGPLPYATQTTATAVRWYREIHQDRLAPQFKAGVPYEDEIRFQMVRMTLPLTFGRARDNSRPAFEEYKGNWQCTVGAGGAVWRIFRFRVGANGMPEAHPEQSGNVALGFNSYLVDLDIPAGGSALDARLNGPSESLFFGQPWTTTPGKSMAARVPRKGNPYPVRSTAARPK